MGNTCCTSRPIDRKTQTDCVFCNICSGEKPSRPVYQNSRIVAFWDRSPAARVHLLVVPRTHIENIDSLTPADRYLVEEMHTTGARLLSEMQPNAKQKLGYHIPPWTSVDHLHLHCFALPHKFWGKELKYSVPHVWMTAEQLEARLAAAAAADPDCPAPVDPRLSDGESAAAGVQNPVNARINEEDVAAGVQQAKRLSDPAKQTPKEQDAPVVVTVDNVNAKL